MDNQDEVIEVQAEPVTQKWQLVKRMWVAFHNSIILAILFTLLGVGVGVKVSKDIYSNKLDEVIQTGAMLHAKKVYTIAPKM